MRSSCYPKRNAIRPDRLYSIRKLLFHCEISLKVTTHEVNRKENKERIWIQYSPFNMLYDRPIFDLFARHYKFVKTDSIGNLLRTKINQPFLFLDFICVTSEIVWLGACVTSIKRLNKQFPVGLKCKPIYLSAAALIFSAQVGIPQIINQRKGQPFYFTYFILGARTYSSIISVFVYK